MILIGILQGMTTDIQGICTKQWWIENSLVET